MALSLNRAIVWWAATSLSASIVATVSATALVLWATGVIRPVLIFAFASIIVSCFLLSQRASAPPLLKESMQRGDGYAIPVCLGAIVIGFLLLDRQFGYASLWGDVGVYVNAAAHFRGGGTIPFGWTVPIWDLDTESWMAPPRGMINPATAGGYQFHGLPTWPALMALSGLGNDGRALLAPLYAMSIFLLYVNAKRLVGDQASAALGALLFALLPLLWHQTLYPSAEMLALTIFLSGMTLVRSGPRSRYFVGLGVFAYGVVHASFLILVPVVGAVVGLYAARSGVRQKGMIAGVSLAISCGALGALAFANATSEVYSHGIVRTLFGEHEYLAIVACSVPFFSALIYWLGKPYVGFARLLKTLERGFFSGFRATTSIALCGILATVVIKAYYLGWTDHYVSEEVNAFSSWSARVAYADMGFKSLLHLSFVNILLATAGLGLIAYLLFPFAGRGKSRLRLLWWFTSVFLFVFGVLRIDIPNNFYASRYFLPVLVPCLMFFSIWIFSRCVQSRWLIAPALLWSLYVNAAMIDARYYSTDGDLVRFMEEQIDEQAPLVFTGSSWLRYHFIPHVMRSSHALATAGIHDADGLNGYSAGLQVVSDREVVVGKGSCMEFVERGIPWQISYISKPSLLNRTICVYEGFHVDPVEISLGVNRWTYGGSLKFVVMARKIDEMHTITFRSRGWWAGKKPFESDVDALRPSLKVCGEEFVLTSLDPHSIVFRGALRSGVCSAELRTETFVPAEIGEGTDKRALGADIEAIAID